MTTSSWKVLSSFICFLFPIILESQTTTIQVPLKKGLAEEPAMVRQFYLYPKPVDLSGIPDNLDTMMFWACPFSTPQFLYEQYQYGRIYERFDGVPFTQEDFEKCKIDKAFITDKAIKYKIYGVSGLRKGKKIIAIDANNNGDLSDEIVMEFDTSGLDLIEDRIGYRKLTSPLVIHYEVFYNGEIHQREKIVSIKPFVKLSKSPGKLFEDLKISMATNEIFLGDLVLDNTKYHVVVNGFLEEEEGKLSNILVSEYGTTQEEIETFQGEIIQVGKTWVRVDTVDFERRQIQFTILEGYEGGNTVWKAPAINTKDLSGKDFSLEALKGKYVFINFWGTWCGPCKAEHPALKNIYEQYKNKNIEFVSIAYDANAEVVRNYLAKEKMNWTSLFVHKKNQEKAIPIIDEYGVNGFPDYILINPDGDIVYKGKLGKAQLALSQFLE